MVAPPLPPKNNTMIGHADRKQDSATRRRTQVTAKRSNGAGREDLPTSLRTKIEVRRSGV